MKFANVETLRRISGDKLITKNVVHLILRVIIIFCLIIAVAGTKLWIMGDSNEVNYVVAMDISASMTSEDVKPSRFLAAKDNINEFVSRLQSRTKLGLVSFAGVSEIVQTMTDSKLDFKIAMEKLSPSATGGTDMSGAMITSTNILLMEQGKGRAIILISDGINTLGASVSDPIKDAAEYAKQNQVIIYTIGVGTNQGPIGYLPEYYNISAYFNPSNLEYIANVTGGKYFYADSANALAQSLAFLGENTSKKYLDYDISFLALLIAICCLFLEWGVANTLYRRIL
jgi:Ca-activated chloride channel family protein